MNDLSQILEIFGQKTAEIERLEESVGQLALRLDQINGWDPLDSVGNFDEGPTLDELHILTKNIRELTTSNPLLKRGCELRGNYVFGNGIVFREVKPAADVIIGSTHNRRVLFSTQGYEELNRAKYTDGNVFVLYNDRTKLFTRVPISQIQGVVTDPNDSENVWLLKRTWVDENNKTKQFWYRTDTCPVSYKQQTVNRVKVDTSSVMFFETANKQVGWTFGVPDALAGVFFALGYSAYLNDNAKLVKAYARFAMKVSSQSVKGVNNVATELRQRGERVGGTAVAGAGNDLVAMPATGSQVDFNKGQPLAAMVAASLGVSVIALLSSPGAAGGSYGAAATLDAPTIIGMGAIQDTWTLFFESVFTHLRSPKTKAEFPAIETDPTYRVLNTITALVPAGILHRQEARDVAIDLLDIKDPQKDLPPEPVAPQSATPPSGDEQGITNNEGRTDTISK